MANYSEMKQMNPPDGGEMHHVAPPYSQTAAEPGYQAQYGYPLVTDPAYQPKESAVKSSNNNYDCWPTTGDDQPEGDKPPNGEGDDESPTIPDKYLNLEFDSCFQEHKSTRTIPIVYKINRYIFIYTKLFFYNLFVIVFGFFFSFIWAMTLGILSFLLTWIWGPALKATMLVVSRVLPAVTEPLKALFTPLVDVQARVFRQIRVRGWFNGGLLSPLAKTQEHTA